MADTERPPAVAGTFYPADPAELASTVAELLAAYAPLPALPHAVISPHAGYRYSGALTAQALAATRAAKPDVVVILSPSHRHAFDGVGLPSWLRFAFPGGTMPVARDLAEGLIAEGLAQICDAAHDREHGIEVQLPFLAQLHKGVPILPLVLGRGGAEAAAQIIDHIAAVARAPLFVLSSDLSHFLTQEEAEARDARTAERLEQGQSDLTAQGACGSAAINAYLISHFGQGARMLRLGMANSAAQTGDATRTVGYGAWALFATEAEILAPEWRGDLLRIARQALTSRLTRGTAPHIAVPSFAPPLQTWAACFVTLEQEGCLRGCIGSLQPQRALVADVAVNVQKAALNDPRFRPMTLSEVAQSTIKIAVLSPRRPIVFHDQLDVELQLRPGHDGLILRDQGKAGTFLPMVWDKLPDPHAFVQALKVKAGLPPDHWSDSLEIDLFHAETFAEVAPPAGSSQR